MPEPPGVLFLSPVMPRATGDGRAMRAYAWVHALAAESPVHVVVVRRPNEGESGGAMDPLGSLPAASIQIVDVQEGLGDLCLRAASLIAPFLVLLQKRGYYYWNACPRRLRAQIRDHLRNRSIDRIVSFRIYLHEFAMLAQSVFPDAAIDLDLDDLEWTTLLSFARIYLRRRRFISALVYTSRACQSWFLTRAVCHFYDRVFLAAEEDAGALLAQTPATKTAVFPNRLAGEPAAISVPPAPPNRILFVGSLTYPPNRDAAELLIDDVAPLLRQRRSTRWEITIAGRCPPQYLLDKCSRTPGINLVGDPADLTRLYRESHIVVVPLRAGGGSKIKTLEAFLYGRPVISTAEGVRGLTVAPNLHYVPAETAAEFAQACAKLAADPAFASRIAAAGQKVVLERYHFE